MISPSKKEKSGFLLLVEGKDDENVIKHLLTQHGITKDKNPAHIESFDGLPKGKEEITARIKSYETIGIVVDFDSNDSHNWEQIKNSIVESLLFERSDFPDSPQKEGTIIPKGNKKVGIWLMPDNSTPGKIENFLATLVPQGDPLWGFSKEKTKDAKEKFNARFSDNDFIKAHVHCWLAWQKEPGKPFGTAISAKFFDHDSEVARNFIDWFKKLFLD